MFDRFRLTHDGLAVVVSCEFAPHGFTSTSSSGGSSTAYNLIVDVHPDGAMPFRAEARHSFSVVLAPSPGTQLKVRCNPETKKVEIDTDGDMRFDVKKRKAARKQALERQHEADLEAPVGSAPAPADAAVGALDPELAEILRLEEEERRNH